MKNPVDPFSPEADPYPEPLPDLSRRALFVAVPTAAALLSGCVGPRLACAPRTDDVHSCQHRFCRYYRGGPAREG